jgi:LPXTG-site transpeptidase (sortase) family protein
MPATSLKERVPLCWIVLSVGLALVVAGSGVIAAGLATGWFAHQQAAARQHDDEGALRAWDSGGSRGLAGAVPAAPSPSQVASQPACGGGSDPGALALVEFTGLPEYDYAAVAVNGDWSDLDDHSMVHWYGSAAPGAEGDVIIAFHREPDFEYIDELSAGDTVTLQDGDCNLYVYTVTQRWVLAPAAVTQLVPTSGHLLTLVTCTPWWVDSQRLVWRATLTSVNGSPVSS